LAKGIDNPVEFGGVMLLFEMVFNNGTENLFQREALHPRIQQGCRFPLPSHHSAVEQSINDHAQNAIKIPLRVQYERTVQGFQRNFECQKGRCHQSFIVEGYEIPYFPDRFMETRMRKSLCR
jgi:hypothetical protein